MIVVVNENFSRRSMFPGEVHVILTTKNLSSILLGTSLIGKNLRETLIWKGFVIQFREQTGNHKSCLSN